MKELIKEIICRFGFQIQKHNIQNSQDLLLNRCIIFFQIDLIIDAGANIGQYATGLRKHGYTKHLFSFEPLINAFDQLKTKSAKDNKWEVFNLGVGSSSGQLNINVSENLVSSSFLPVTEASTEAAPKSRFSSTQTVNVVRLDEFLIDRVSGFENIFLKIDVQGFELEVLKGAEALLSKVKVIQLEMSFVPMYKDGPLFADVLSTLDKLGFEIYTIIPEFRNETSGRMLQADGIFIRKG
jgi:FkbM family methyltransferase